VKRRSLRLGCLGLLGILVVLVAAATVYGLRYSALASEGDAEVSRAPDESDVAYCGVADPKRSLDVYYAAQREPGVSSPALVYVHGGGFTGGDKAKGNGLAEVSALAARGYLVASVNYRLAPGSRFPAPIEDVKCAIRYLRANAEALDVDPDRIGIWGGSAGGNLALLAGLTGDDAFLAGEHLKQSGRVSAVVDMFGPTDLTAGDFSFLESFLLGRAFGTTDPGDPLLARASPVTYAKAGAPPILILHGEVDDVVPLSQSKAMYERLRAAGAPATLVTVANANHNFAPTAGPINPTRHEITKLVGDFFDAHLKP
jgi:acetyl esterase/lipase